MSKWIVGAVLCGIAAGYFILPPWVAEHCGTFITVGLCLILFLVGVDMGRQGGVWRDISTPHIEDPPHKGDTVIGNDVWLGSKDLDAVKDAVREALAEKETL